jgi:fatty-acyl-CoA synthase
MITTEPLNIGQVLTAQARLQPNWTGARDLTRHMSFRQWNQRACRLANALTGLGLTKGDRVAVLAYNRLEWAEIFVAAAKAGLIAVPINFRLTGVESQYIIENSGATALICEDADTGHRSGSRQSRHAGRPLHPDRFRPSGRPVAILRRLALLSLGQRT